MSQIINVSDIILQAKQRTNHEKKSPFSNTEYAVAASSSIRAFNDMLLAMNPSFKRSSYTFTTVASSGSYDLPSDFFSDRGLDAFVAGAWRDVPNGQYDDRNAQGNDGRFFRYLIEGDSLLLFPSPIPAGVQFRLNYYPTPGSSPTFDGINGWEEWVVLDICCKVATKAEFYELKSSLRQDQAIVEARIRKVASSRSSNRGPMPADRLNEQLASSTPWRSDYDGFWFPE